MFPFMGLGGKRSFYPYPINQAIKLPTQSDYLTRTVSGSPTNGLIFTLSFWVKRGIISPANNAGIITGGADINNRGTLLFAYSTDKLQVFRTTSGSTINNNSTLNVFRDVAHWYHIVFQYDSTQAVAADRQKFYINGVFIPHDSSNNITQNISFKINVDTSIEYIGLNYWGGTDHLLDGYLAEFIMVDGYTIVPYEFGQFKYNTWIPKDYSGSYGANGYHLKFDNVSNLGEDSSGNGNDWTEVGTPVQTEDTPTNNYPIFDILQNRAGTISKAGLQLVTGTTEQKVYPITSACPMTGKWQVEYKINGVNGYSLIGILSIDDFDFASGSYGVTGSWFYNGYNGNFNSEGSVSSYGNTFTQDDIIGVFYDADTGELVFYKNGVSQGVAVTLDNSKQYIFCSGDVSSTYTESHTLYNGAEGFTYPIEGAKALCTKNYSKSETPILDADRGFWNNGYTGNGTTQEIMGAGFNISTKSMIIIKNRDDTNSSNLIDTVRGAGYVMYPNLTNAQAYDANNVTAFADNGFTVGSNVGINDNTETYDSWIFNMIPKYGMDIVMFTGNGTIQNIPHNLGYIPELIIIKCYSAATAWVVGCSYLDATNPWNYYLLLNTNDVRVAETTVWNNTAPTSSIFTVGSNSGVNYSGRSYVAYLYRSVNGFIKFGNFIGNGSTDGARIHTGFRPTMVLWKTYANIGSHWNVVDTVLNPYNVQDQFLQWSSTQVESGSTGFLDFLSNGFKARYNWSSSYYYIYMAIAGTPFPYANAF